MKLKIFSLFMFSVLAINNFAQASEGEGNKPKKSKKRVSRTYQTPFGMAGCGLGSMIIDEKDKSSQAIASLINFYVGGISSSITSGTSNCNYGNATSMIEQKVYLSSNLRTLEKEAAIGSGPHLEALAELFGCEGNDNLSAFGNFNKTEYSRLYNSENPEKVWENLQEVGKTSDITAKCSGLG